MRSVSPAALAWWTALAVASAAPAQSLVHRDGPIVEPRQAAFDPARGRLVVAARLGETWEYDGAAWFPRAAGRRDWADARLVHDGHRLVAFLTTMGLGAETWAYDGIGWTSLSRTGQPPGRTDTMMAFDAARNRIVLHAGTAAIGPNYYLTDTWEWDGTLWAQQTPAVVPPWRRSAAMAFDPQRGVTVLFGGDGQTGFRQDTWEWDGTAWTQRSPAVQPSARIAPAMVFDPGLGRLVVYGGLDPTGVRNDLWAFDGVVWQQLSTSNPGPPRWQHSLHHDPVRNELLVLGGTPAELHVLGGGVWRAGPVFDYTAVTGGPGAAAVDPASGGVVRFGSLFDGRTHTWDRTSWRTLQPAVAPVPRIFGSMWSDGQYAWLFGGINTLLGVSYGDTWRWDGASWLPIAPATTPSPRYDSAVAFDSALGVAVLFGGSSGWPQDDTWTFQGTTWSQRSPAVRPPARSGHGLAFDPLRNRTVLFGGTGSNLAQRFADTWEWNGTNWQQVVTPQSPLAIGTAALGFDARRQRILLSQSGTQHVAASPPTLWTYDGVTWTPLPLAQNLAIQPTHEVLALPLDPDPVLVDGYSVLQLSVAPPAVANAGTGCGPVPLRLWVRTVPRPGAAQFGLELDRAPAGAATVLLAALAPGNVVVGGCAVGVDPAGLPVFGLADARGAVAVPVPLAPSPSLVGLGGWFQAFALAPGTTTGFVASPTLHVVVGD